ncbi:MAG: DUF1599 domain-containing protein [Chitinophagaceae bacterium]|nr:DUF1599 domain-containing protein [Chitinophagaceae bacterium]MCW5927483.1 DUF1599 domain-containing protein [Chitinophagaceae bacterium]
MSTIAQYNEAVQSAKDIFLKKTLDYGTSWRVLRTISVVDQIFIKARRIRTLQEAGVQKVEDSISSEFKGILNYGVVGLIQLELQSDEVEDLEPGVVDELYSKVIDKARTLMELKNHDYGEAWRDMSQESFTDLVLSKLLRIKQILSNKGKTLISEGADANFFDIINYAVFALILIGEGKHRG